MMWNYHKIELRWDILNITSYSLRSLRIFCLTSHGLARYWWSPGACSWKYEFGAICASRPHFLFDPLSLICVFCEKIRQVWTSKKEQKPNWCTMVYYGVLYHSTILLFYKMLCIFCFQQPCGAEAELPQRRQRLARICRAASRGDPTLRRDQENQIRHRQVWTGDTVDISRKCKRTHFKPWKLSICSKSSQLAVSTGVPRCRLLNSKRNWRMTPRKSCRTCRRSWMERTRNCKQCPGDHGWCSDALMVSNVLNVFRTFQIVSDWDCGLMHFVIISMIFFLFRQWFGILVHFGADATAIVFGHQKVGSEIMWTYPKLTQIEMHKMAKTIQDLFVYLVHPWKVSTSLEELQKQRKDNELYQDILFLATVSLEDLIVLLAYFASPSGLYTSNDYDYGMICYDNC